jgi:predicted site-specific integrase-resolvase
MNGPGFEGDSKRRTDGQAVGRLMSLRAGAVYTGIPYWTLREYVLDGLVPSVRLPCTRIRAKGGKVIRHANDEIKSRRIYVDRDDLDQFIEEHKGAA